MGGKQLDAYGVYGRAIKIIEELLFAKMKNKKIAGERVFETEDCDKWKKPQKR